MSHILLRKKFEDPARGKTWVFFCACGKMMGGLHEATIEQHAGDLLDAHREHVRATLEYEYLLTSEFGFAILDPCRGSQITNRAYEVNQRLFELQMIAELPPLPVLPSKAL